MECRVLVILAVVFTGTVSGYITKDLSSSNGDVTWILKNNNLKAGRVKGSVPGGVYSDLMKAKIIGDILYGSNDVITRWIAYDSWSYIALFNVTAEELKNSIVQLVLHGVDTVAFVDLNEVPVGATNNMFVRYVFNIKTQLQVGENRLRITFASPIEVAKHRSEKHFTAPDCVPMVYNGECHVNQLRKMQASFSWDWGPAFPSIGVWKPALIEFYNGAIIRSVTSHLNKEDNHWNLQLLVFLESSIYKAKQTNKGTLKAVLKVDGNQRITMGKEIESHINEDGTFEAGLNLIISKNVVSLWWPNGYGEQPLYDLAVYYTDDLTGEESIKTLQIGFRTIELVEEDASLVLGNTTAGNGLTFYFKVNGYPIFMKGSNWIPAHILPELVDLNTVDDLLVSARDVHMSMLRVWGGGVYESDHFYSRCDQLGILIWQDFLFACSMYPTDKEFLESVKIEIEQNVIRLQHHPSIAVWAGNNENEVALRGNWYHTKQKFDKYKAEYKKLYVDTIKPIVERLDPGRRYLTSSPSNGLESEKEDYVAQNPYDPHFGDTHYYNYLADSWNPSIYPNTRFASEYGLQSIPSLHTMSQSTNKSEDFDVHSNFFEHRQHSPNGNDFMINQVSKHLNLEEGEKDFFKKLIFYSQITQAMAMKVETEVYRQAQADWYTMGALYWQLNDVWQAPSWSGIEYGGKWKMLHYYAKSFFSPVLVSPRLTAGNVVVYLLNDRLVPIVEGQITVDYYNWSSLIPYKSESYPANAEPLSSKKHNISINLWKEKNRKEIFLRFSLAANGVQSSPYNYIFPAAFKDVKNLQKPQIHIKVSEDKFSDPSTRGYNYIVDIEVDNVVLFLWLEADTLKGRFLDNGFIVTQPNFRVNYESKENVTLEALRKAITYQYYLN